MTLTDTPARSFETITEGTYHARLAAERKPVVVLFSNAGCGSCRVWRRLLPVALDALVETFFEVDVGEATGVARYFGIFHLPAIYLYRDGQFHAELHAEARPQAIRLALQTLLAAPPQDEP
jgi:thioredoxin 1